MENQYIVYLKDNKVQKYRTFKSYVGFKLKTYVSAKIKAFWAYIDEQSIKTTQKA